MTLSALFTASLVSANLLGSKLVLIGPVTVSIGLFVFPFTFVLADITAELYGKQIASRLVRTGIATQLYVLAFVELGAWLPASPARDVSAAYNQMFTLTPRMVLASIIAYTISQIFEVRLFIRLRGMTNGRYLWLRSSASIAISQAIDTMIFSAIFLGGVLSLPELLKTGSVAYLSKLVMGMIDSPFVNLGVWALTRKPAPTEPLQQVTT